MEGTGRALLGLIAVLLALPIIIIAAIGGGGSLGTGPTTATALGCGEATSGEATGAGLTLPSGVTLTAEMRDNARTIAQVAADLGVPDQGAVIALTTALVESELINVEGGDRDSLGLFQQRPSQGWGTAEEIMDPATAAGSFYEALLAVPGWPLMTPGAAAQAVQRSAYADRYAQRVDDAATILADLTSAPALCSTDPYELVEVHAPAGAIITVAASIAPNLTALLDAAAADGVSLGGWGYRSAERQIELREQNCGTDQYAIYEMPSSECSPPTARPGTSLHETGLAIDFTCYGTLVTVRRGDACDIWLTANAATYGLYNLPSEAWHYSSTGS